MPLALRPLALAGSALAHGLAAWALLQAPAALPPDPPVLMDLAMPAPEVAEAQAAPPRAPSAEAAADATPPAAAPDPVAPEPPQAEAEAPPEEAPPPSPDAPIALAEAPDAQAEPPAETLPPAPPEPPPPPLRGPPVPRPPASRPQPRPAAPDAASAAAASPSPAPPAPPGPAAAPPPSWLGEISAALGRHRAYPARLRAERVTGVVLLRFSVDRAGQVLARQVERSSGHPELDALALDLLLRAAPLPPPPGDLPGQRIELVVPVRYALR